MANYGTRQTEVMMTLRELAHIFGKRIRALRDPDDGEWIIYMPGVQILEQNGRPVRLQHGNGATRASARKRYASRLRGRAVSVVIDTECRRGILRSVNYPIPRTLVA
jgi:hypothetical protein